MPCLAYPGQASPRRSSPHHIPCLSWPALPRHSLPHQFPPYHAFPHLHSHAKPIRRCLAVLYPPSETIRSMNARIESGNDTFSVEMVWLPPSTKIRQLANYVNICHGRRLGRLYTLTALGVVALRMRAKRNRGAIESPIDAFGGADKLDGVRQTPQCPSEGCIPTRLAELVESLSWRRLRLRLTTLSR